MAMIRDIMVKGKRERGILPLLLTFLLMAGVVRAEFENFSFRLSYDNMASSNIFNNYEGIEDVVNRFGMGLSYFPSSELEVYVDSYYSSFANNSYLNYLVVEAGLDWVKYLKGRSLVFVTGGLTFQQFGKEYDYYNYYQPFLTAGIKYYLAETVLLRTAYEFYYTNFRYFPDYSSQKHYFFLQLNKFFLSAVTLRFETGGGIKKYDTDGSRIMQVYTRVRFSKGFGYRFGVSAEGSLKKNFISEARPGRIEESFFFTTPFYDELSWEGTSGFVMAKAILPLKLETSLKFAYYNRSFPNIRALDLNGYPIEPVQYRKDELKEMSLALGRKWELFSLFFKFILRKNSSNDPYFNFSDKAAFLSLKMNI